MQIAAMVIHDKEKGKNKEKESSEEQIINTHFLLSAHVFVLDIEPQSPLTKQKS